MINRLSKWLVESFLAAVAVCGSLFCLISAFELSVNPLTVIFIAIVASMLFTAGFQTNKLSLTLIPAVLLLILYLFFNGTAVYSAAQQLAHDLLSKFSSAYKNIAFAIPSEPAAFQPAYYTAFFCITAVVLSLWMAWGIGYRSCLISVAGTLPLLLLCVIINDTPPNAFPLVLLLSVWITVLLEPYRTTDSGLVDATRLTLLFLSVLLVFGFIGMIYPKDDTSSQSLPEVIEELMDLLPERLQDLLSRDSNCSSSQKLGADTADTLDLTKQGVRSRTDTIMMQISTTESGILYLRASAKDIYTGTAWKSRDEATPSESEYAHTSLGLQFGDDYQAAIQIKNYRDDTSTAFLPYGFISCNDNNGINFNSDLRININEDDYVIYYWPGVSSVDLTQQYSLTDTDYDSYVSDTCLELPEGIQEELYSIAVDNGYDARMTNAETIAWVVSYLNSVASYRLNVSCQPSNFDFAEYFLTESQEGYCVHFATAACVLYRALGIPARYASGYRVEITEAGTITDVTDEDTHAWAEVYISGLGWIPIEVTPGFGDTTPLPEVPNESTLEPETEPDTDQEESEQEDAEPEASSMEQNQQEEYSQEETADDPTEDAEPSASAASEQIPAEPSSDPSVSDDLSEEIPAVGIQSANRHLRLYLFLLLIPVIIAATTCIIVFRRKRLLETRKENFAQENLNQAAIYMWDYIQQLTPYGANSPAEAESVALRAKFSQHTLTQEELNIVQQAVEQQYLSVYSQLNRRKLFIFRWVHVLELPK